MTRRRWSPSLLVAGVLSKISLLVSSNKTDLSKENTVFSDKVLVSPCFAPVPLKYRVLQNLVLQSSIDRYGRWPRGCGSS